MGLRKKYMCMARATYHMNPESRTLALLIDAENTELPLIERVLAEADRHGIVRVRRAYGDWKSDRMSVWGKCLVSHGIEMIRQSEPVYARNSADHALQKDAWAMLRSREVDGFCIVASDSGYAGLVMEMRKQGIFVMGISAQDKSPSYSERCNVFRYVELLPQPVKPDDAAYEEVDIGLIDNINKAICSSPRAEDGWALLADVKNRLPDLDPRDYCYVKMSSLVQMYPREFETRKGKTDRNSVVYHIRSKRML